MDEKNPTLDRLIDHRSCDWICLGHLGYLDDPHEDKVSSAREAIQDRLEG
ncbi:hypothetical protein [Pyrococcus horikoshii]|nr:hypothetical protein [Pyrococcus horikoshii]